MPSNQTTRSFLQRIDLLADTVSMTYKGHRTHPTKCGGAITLIFTTFLSIFFVSRCRVLINMEGDRYFQSKIYYSPDENFIELYKQRINIHANFVGTGNATNFDQNEYFSFKLHRYHNIWDNNISLPKLDKFVDQIIPMVPCNDEKHDNDNGWDHSATLFCP